MDEIQSNNSEQGGLDIVHEMPAESKYQWLQGFLDIIASPHSFGLGFKNGSMKIFFLAVLIESFAAVFGNYLLLSNADIRMQTLELMSPIIEKMEENPRISESDLEKAKEEFEQSVNFQFLKSLGTSIGLALAAGLVLGALFWVAHRLFTSEPLPYISVLTLSSYGASISAIGAIVSALMQTLSSSLLAAPNLSFVVNPLEHPSWFAFLTRITLFSIWYYAAVGTAIAGAIRLHSRYGYIFGGIVWTIVLLVIGGATWVVSLVMDMMS